MCVGVCELHTSKTKSNFSLLRLFHLFHVQIFHFIFLFFFVYFRLFFVIALYSLLLLFFFNLIESRACALRTFVCRYTAHTRRRHTHTHTHKTYFTCCESVVSFERMAQSFIIQLVSGNCEWTWYHTLYRSTVRMRAKQLNFEGYRTHIQTNTHTHTNDENRNRSSESSKNDEKKRKNNSRNRFRSSSSNANR